VGSWANRTRALLVFDLQSQLIELALVDSGGRAGHEIEGAGRLGEGDDLPDGLLAGEEHDQPVEAVGDAAVGRGAQAQGFEEIAELVLGLPVRQAQSPEDAPLDVHLVDPDRPAADLVAVEDEVVGLRPDLGGRRLEEGEILVDRRGEGVVHRDEAALLHLEERLPAALFLDPDEALGPEGLGLVAELVELA